MNFTLRVNLTFTLNHGLLKTTPLMSLNAEKLEGFKQHLTSRRQSLARDLEKTTAGLIDEDPFHSDAVDQASADTDRDIIVRIQNRDRAILVEIDQALRRIDEGSFGECGECGEPIAEARMRARGCEKMEVTSNLSLVDAHAFYEALGLERSSLRFFKDI